MSSVKIKATVYIHGGDYDCSEAVRMCYRAVGVLPYGSYMWTGNELELLKANGFREIDFGSIGDGDVLWKTGHTEMYLAGGYQGGARIDEVGGIHGPKQGDQTGGEIARSKFVRSNWTKALRYFGPVTIDGIPARFAAARVMDHLIDHAAHGYSQDNRKGDGTLEAVQITWDDSSPVANFVRLQKAFTYRFWDRVRVRTAPTTQGDTFQGVWWEVGQTATFDGIAFGDGFIWGTYIGPTTKKRLFVAIGEVTHGTPSL